MTAACKLSAPLHVPRGQPEAGRAASHPRRGWGAGGEGADAGLVQGETGSPAVPLDAPSQEGKTKIAKGPIRHPLPSPEVRRGHLQLPRPRRTRPAGLGRAGPAVSPTRGTVCEAPASQFPSHFPAKPLGRRQPPSERPEPPRENRWLRVWRVCVLGTSHVITASDGGSMALFL